MDVNTIEHKIVPYIRPVEKGTRTAFTVMSCQPLHLGHVRVINRMILDYKTVIIGLEKAPPQPTANAPFTDGQRIKMLHNVYGNRVRVVGIENRVAAIFLRAQLVVVISAFLAVDERVIRLRKQGKLSSGFRVRIEIGVAFAREFPVSRFDLGLSRSGLNA